MVQGVGFNSVISGEWGRVLVKELDDPRPKLIKTVNLSVPSRRERGWTERPTRLACIGTLSLNLHS